MINAGSFKLSTFLARHITLFFLNSSFMEPKSYYFIIFREHDFCIQEWDLNNSLNDLPSEREFHLRHEEVTDQKAFVKEENAGRGVECNCMNKNNLEVVQPWQRRKDLRNFLRPQIFIYNTVEVQEPKNLVF